MGSLSKPARILNMRNQHRKPHKFKNSLANDAVWGRKDPACSLGLQSAAMIPAIKTHTPLLSLIFILSSFLLNRVINCSAFTSFPCSVRPAAATKKIDISYILEKKSPVAVLRGFSNLPSPSKVAPFAVQKNDGEKSVASSWNTNKSLGIVLLLSCCIVFNSPLFSEPVFAFEDYASDTVTAAVKNLNDAVGDKDKSFLALKNVAEIITDGKGVGGSLSYSGVQLERGLVADEDTSIYNPGLTLLSESEKQSLVDAVIKNRKSNMLQNSWSEDNQRGYDFLKQNLDPFHTVELKGYLKILPYYGAAVYLATLFVQQNARQLFTAAYIAGVVAIFAPVIVLISNGP